MSTSIRSMLDSLTTMHPGRNGGWLRTGNPGNRGGTGRPSNAMRAALAREQAEYYGPLPAENTVKTPGHENLKKPEIAALTEVKTPVENTVENNGRLLGNARILTFRQIDGFAEAERRWERSRPRVFYEEWS